MHLCMNTLSDKEAEDEIKKKKKRKKRKRRSSSSDCDSDETIIYEESYLEMLNRKSSDQITESENQSDIVDPMNSGESSRTYKNIFTERPEVHKEEFECLCGATSPGTHRGRKKKHAVQCTVCRLWQHAECVNYNLQDPLRGEFKCPHCHVASVSVSFPTSFCLYSI